MKKFLMATLLVAISSLSAKAGLLVSGEVEQFTGPGQYTLDIIAQAVGQSENVEGFTLQVGGFTNPAFSFVSRTYNPNYETTVNNAVSGGFLTMQGANTAGAGVTLATGQSAVLASFTFNASEAGLFPFSFVGGGFFNENFDEINFAVGSAPELQAVPAPAGLLALCSLAFAGSVSRLRRRRA